MTTRPTLEQKATREQLAQNRKRNQEKKIRDRRLYRVGEVMEAHGYEDPKGVEELMKTVDETLAHTERARDSDVAFHAAVERAVEEEERERDDPCPDYLLANLRASGRQTSVLAAPGNLVVAVVAGALLGVVLHALWQTAGRQTLIRSRVSEPEE